MRKTNVFGKKINPSQPLYLLILVFFVTLISYLVLLYISSIRISDLEEERITLQQSINQLLISEQTNDYQSIDELLPFLPDEFNQSVVYNELILIRDLSGLNSADNYRVSFTLDADNPFGTNLSSSLNYVKISITMDISDYQNVFDYMENLIDADRLFYVSNLDLNILTNDNAMVEIDFFTFYMD